MKRCCAKGSIGVLKLNYALGKSRRDDTLLTVGFNLRERDTYYQVPQGRHVTHQVSSLRDLVGGRLYRRLKPTVNKVLSLRDWAHLFRKRYRAESPQHLECGGLPPLSHRGLAPGTTPSDFHVVRRLYSPRHEDKRWAYRRGQAPYMKAGASSRTPDRFGHHWRVKNLPCTLGGFAIRIQLEKHTYATL